MTPATPIPTPASGTTLSQRSKRATTQRSVPMAAPAPAIIGAIFNQAGGTGKSTVALHLGSALARRGRRVLLVDLDPQASLTLFCGLDPQDLDPAQTTAATLLEGAPLRHVSVEAGLELAPGGVALAEAELGGSADPDLFARAMEALRADFDTILIDCPPTLGFLSVAALSAADTLLVPVETQYKAFRGADLLVDTVARIREQRNPRLRIRAFLPTRFDARQGQDRQVLASMQAGLAAVAPIWEPIPRAVAYADASIAGKPLFAIQPRHPHLAIWDRLAILWDHRPEPQ